MMDEKQMIESAKAYIENLFAADYSGHDVDHSLRVYHHAMLLADTEPRCNHLTHIPHPNQKIGYFLKGM